ncbi:MAG TPA: hypothetical protein VGX78_17000 [Pirellulales bacterium]|jgi:hypothetical protein|nr:hypothetical protein [Pirellulales bacterium]
MTDLTLARRFKNRLRVASIERLESRELLSADAAPSIQQFEIAITGTQVSYSPAGLPTDMKGTVYFTPAAGAAATAIGTYDEALQPIFMPLGPGGAPAFVGCNGVCTFDFNLSLGGLDSAVTLGSITATDTAFIEGVRPDGTILVDSNHSPITGATGICHGVNGSFNGQSEVIMGATFSMHTIVDFTVSDLQEVELNETLTGLAFVNSGAGQWQGEPRWVESLADDGGASQATVAHLESLADRLAAVDNVFAGDSDTLGDGDLGL